MINVDLQQLIQALDADTRRDLEGSAERCVARGGSKILVEDLLLGLLERVGHMPLPPYIDRADEGSDRERYQTVYAERAGAVAAWAQRGPYHTYELPRPMLSRLLS